MRLNGSVKELSLKVETENGDITTMAYLSILLGCIIVLGVCANIVNIIVFSRKSMRKTSTFRFLFYLSIVDLLVLLISALEAFDRGIGHRLKLREISNFSCKVINRLFEKDSIKTVTLNISFSFILGTYFPYIFHHTYKQYFTNGYQYR